LDTALLIRAPEGLEPSRSGRCPAHVGSEEARLIALALASVRRSNWTCSFPASSFHEDVFF
jgi:hypothetical protein